MDFGFDIVEAFKIYGVIPTIGLVVLFGFKSHLSTIFFFIWNKLFPKKSVADLRKHPSFHQMENYIAVKIPGIPFEDTGRGEVFKDMLTTMFRSYIDNMRHFISENFNERMEATFSSNDDFIQKLFSSNLKCITDYEDKWRKMQVPLICITKFNEWHSGKRDILFADIQVIANSSFHLTYNEKLASFMDLIFIILNVSILDADYILKDLNGELSGQRYKGIVIGHGEPTYVIRTSDESSGKHRSPYTKKPSEIITFKEE